MTLSRNIQILASALSCLATATFFVLSLYIFLEEVLGIPIILNIPVAILFGGAAAAVIQLSIVSSVTIASERSRPSLERKIAMLKTLGFWSVGLIFGYSMWFASISFKNYENVKTEQNYQYVDAQLQSNITATSSLSSTFEQLAFHSESAAKNEKSDGNTCANKNSDSGKGQLSKSHKLDAANFRSQAKALAPITTQLNQIYAAFESKNISPKVAAIKANAVLSSPALLAKDQLVASRLADQDCEDAFMTSQLLSIQSYTIATLNSSNLDTPSLSKDTMEAPIALLLCIFTFECTELTDYGIHIWLPPLVITLVIDISILGSTWVLARQKPLVNWNEFYPKGKTAMLQLMLKFHVYSGRSSILIPTKTTTPTQESISILICRLEAHGFVYRRNTVSKLTSTAKATLNHVDTETSYTKFDIDPEFWRELNKEAIPETSTQQATEKPPSKVVSIFKNAFAGNKNF